MRCFLNTSEGYFHEICFDVLTFDGIEFLNNFFSSWYLVCQLSTNWHLKSRDPHYALHFATLLSFQNEKADYWLLNTNTCLTPICAI